MADKRDLKILPGGGGSDRRKKESDRLDKFLDGLADPGVMRSLREEEDLRRRRWMLAATLILGLLLGGGGTWLALRFVGKPPATASASSEKEARELVNQAEELMRVKELDRAWVNLRLATRLAPNIVDTWDALGRSYFYGGQTVEAEQAMRRCLEIDPGHTRAYHLLGDIHFYSGDSYDKAREDWRKAGAKRALARLNLLEGRIDEAAPLIRELARGNPDDRYVQVMTEAVRAGRVTAELRPSLLPHYVLSRNATTAQGWRLFYAGRHTEASTTFSHALQREPGDGSAMIGRGWSLLKMGSFREAQSYFEQALARWPSSYGAMNGLAWSRKGQGQSEGALRLWERLLGMPHTIHIEIPESLKGMGTVYFERGDYVRANSYLARSVVMNPYDQETEKLLDQTLQKLAAYE
ncbi:MAG TPA: tetratricopeptide repeat protein [Thermoanaerobaculia bacterium]